MLRKSEHPDNQEENHQVFRIGEHGKFFFFLYLVSVFLFLVPSISFSFSCTSIHCCAYTICLCAGTRWTTPHFFVVTVMASIGRVLPLSPKRISSMTSARAESCR